MKHQPEPTLRLPRDAVWPDYGDGGLFGLIRSFSEFLDGADWHAPGTPSAAGKGATTVVFMLIDGLGDHFLERHGQGSRLLAHRKCRLTSVFPSTTASAVTTAMTGLSPAEHGLTGWHIHDHHFGGVLAPLPLKMRAGGPVEGLRVPERLFPYRNLFQRRMRASVLVSPQEIAWSAFSRRHGRGARTKAYAGGAAGMADAVVDSVSSLQDEGGGYVHAYHPRFDSLSHDFGPESEEAIAEFWRIDEAFAQLVERLTNTSTDLVVSADHGFTACDDAHQIMLNDYVAFADMLAAPLCGERRAAYCTVRNGAAGDFEVLADEVFAGKAVIARSTDLHANGLFGPGKPHSRLNERIGTHTLLMEPGWTVVDRMASETVHPMLGVHGGLSPDEMWVPLIHARCGKWHS